MLEWFNSNSLAVQAISSLTNLLATIGLVGVTAWYAKSASRQVRATEEQAGREARREAEGLHNLESIAEGLLESLAGFPQSSIDADAAMDKAPTLSNASLIALTKSASVVGREGIPLASEAVRAARIAWTQVEAVRRTSSIRGYNWSVFSWEEYLPALASAKRDLRSLIELVQRVGSMGAGAD
jgi:hypothetical protein